MGRMKLPRAILFDLDDTILVAFGPAQSQWQRTIGAFADQLGPIEATVIAAAIEATSTELWADPGRHKYWRFSAAHSTGLRGLTLCQCMVNIDALAIRQTLPGC
jgi:hypothetical protein